MDCVPVPLEGSDLNQKLDLLLPGRGSYRRKRRCAVARGERQVLCLTNVLFVSSKKVVTRTRG